MKNITTKLALALVTLAGFSNVQTISTQRIKSRNNLAIIASAGLFVGALATYFVHRYVRPIVWGKNITVKATFCEKAVGGGTIGFELAVKRDCPGWYLKKLVQKKVSEIAKQINKTVRIVGDIRISVSSEDSNVTSKTKTLKSNETLESQEILYSEAVVHIVGNIESVEG